MFFQQTPRETPPTSPDPLKSKREAKFVEQIISRAKKRFITGPKYRHQQPKTKDGAFLRSANHIPGTRFIAAAGPRGQTSLENFLTDILSHDPPVSSVVALGDRLSDSDKCAKGDDFLNYYNKDYRAGNYLVSARLCKGEFRTIPTDKSSTPLTFAQSKVTVGTGSESIQFTVTALELADRQYLDLNEDPDDKKKEILWNIFRIDHEQPVLVHCRHGHGRTGHLIFMMELLRHYDNIFAAGDPEIAADAILEILENIRTPRPGLVHSREQFTSAIRNVILLHQYGLEKGYIARAEEEDNTTGTVCTL
ncbi:protein-tyrosine phosphatase family protein [Legionella spiritensis]|uniref:Protein-tyrosine phosphatase n=1 Tax=Legionella spiritensis TaxID=452 RepID=A0A0W0Z5B0_LEGSP|nr:protein-tyrosine phosphatase family protein [Legionella spiritensis]KTD64332.1 Protein-tyrosine phosphatase [Legionella spiritensis]SNV46538.1 Protein-tyrosine phosphatase [Legionella spiritensis]